MKPGTYLWIGAFLMVVYTFIGMLILVGWKPKFVKEDDNSNISSRKLMYYSSMFAIILTLASLVFAYRYTRKQL